MFTIKLTAITSIEWANPSLLQGMSVLLLLMVLQYLLAKIK
jgi:hypothetical protein